MVFVATGYRNSDTHKQDDASYRSNHAKLQGESSLKKQEE